MGIYVKAPVAVGAFQIGGESEAPWPDWFEHALSNGDATIEMYQDTGRIGASIKTLEGEMTASPGDYVIRGTKGEIYPCKADIFEETYVDMERLLEGSDGDGKIAIVRKTMFEFTDGRTKTVSFATVAIDDEDELEVLPWA